VTRESDKQSIVSDLVTGSPTCVSNLTTGYTLVRLAASETLHHLQDCGPLAQSPKGPGNVNAGISVIPDKPRAA